MKFQVIYGAETEVFKEDQLYLLGKQKNYFKSYRSFYKGGKLILKSDLFSLFFFARIGITFQDLPHQIEYMKPTGFFTSCMKYDTHYIQIVPHFFKNPVLTLYLDERWIGEVTVPSIMFYDPSNIKYTMVTDSEDETVNLYLLFAFLLQLTP